MNYQSFTIQGLRQPLPRTWEDDEIYDSNSIGSFDNAALHSQYSTIMKPNKSLDYTAQLKINFQIIYLEMINWWDVVYRWKTCFSSSHADLDWTVSLPRVRRAEQSEARKGILRGPLIGHKLVNNFIRLTAGSAKNDIANTEKHEATILPIHVWGTVSP